MSIVSPSAPWLQRPQGHTHAASARASSSGSLLASRWMNIIDSAIRAEDTQCPPDPGNLRLRLHLWHPCLGPRPLWPSSTTGFSCRSFGCLILGSRRHEHFLSKALWLFRAFVFVGESSYCLYLMHFNLWNLLHAKRHPARSPPRQPGPLDQLRHSGHRLRPPATLYLVEKPAQKVLQPNWLNA